MLDAHTHHRRRVRRPGSRPQSPGGYRPAPAAITEAVLIVLRMLETEALSRPLTPDLTGSRPVPPDSRR